MNGVEEGEVEGRMTSVTGMGEGCRVVVKGENDDLNERIRNDIQLKEKLSLCILLCFTIFYYNISIFFLVYLIYRKQLLFSVFDHSSHRNNCLNARQRRCVCVCV